MLRTLLVLAVASFTGAACASDDSALAPALEIGTGSTSFVPIADGDTVYLARGCQGSQHVWTSLRLVGLDRHAVVVDLALVRLSDEHVASYPFTVRITFRETDDPSVHEITGLTLATPEPDALLGVDVEMRVTATDRAGARVSAAKRVRVEWGTETCDSRGGGDAGTS